MLNQENYNGFAALESPTGTGKTLSVICSVLGWVNEMKRQKKFDGKIMYVTRTHSQISQIINELKKTNYKPKAAILSSREFSCINDELKEKENININIINIICRNIKKKCIYKNEFEGNFLCDLSEDNIVDIEDLCKCGK